MDWKEFFKPTVIKVLMTIILPILLSMLFFSVWEILASEFRSGQFHRIWEFGLGIAMTKACAFVPGPGIDISCAISKFLTWWIPNLIIYYVILSAIFYKLKK